MEQKLLLEPNKEKMIRSIFQMQKQNLPVLAATTARERIEKLKALKQALLAREEDIKEAITRDFGKAGVETELTESVLVLSEINHTISHLKNWMKPVRVKNPITLLGARSEIRTQPRGRVLILSPWNYPYMLSLAPLTAAVSAGNSVILKPSEFSPAVSSVLKEILAEVFPEDEVAVLEGDAGLSSFLTALPFDHIFYTGSTPVGKMVMTAAAQNLASVTLELGGKSPVFIDKSADLKMVARRLMWGKCVNAGQSCLAPDYILIPRNLMKPFLKESRAALEKLYGSEARLEYNPDYARIINGRHFSRLEDMLKNALDTGAKIALGGRMIERENFISPTLLTNVNLKSKIMQDEIFGPLLPLIPYDSVDEALNIVNGKEKPLSLYVFSRDNKAVEYILSRTSSGGTTVNDVMTHIAHNNLPFGGVNHSGHGAYHGHHGFKAFSHERAVLTQSRFALTEIVYPPYTGKVAVFVKFTKKFLI